MKYKIEQLIRNVFTVDYTKIIEHKYAHRCSISTQCTKCASWSMITIDALVKRISLNNIPYICRKCVISIKMKAPKIRQKCKAISNVLWSDQAKKQSMLDKSNETKLKTRIDKKLNSQSPVDIAILNINKRFKSSLNKAFDD